MDKEYIKKLAKDPRFIPGIHNYCDRWCERCPLTSRCMSFELSEEHFGDPRSRDINNKAFWQKIHEVFQITLEMVKETAQQQGIDLDSLDLQENSDDQIISNIAENHECARAAKAYSEMVENWFDSSESLFKEKEDNLNLQARLQLPDSDPAGQAAALKEAVDIIRWYQHFIYIKLLHSIEGSLTETPKCLDEFPKDCDGSAKIALIAMDRSIAAWVQLQNLFPQQADGILDILVHLNRLRLKTQTVLPNARAFVRPGFD